MKFEIGIIVQLKSGGPTMTVKGIIGDSNSPVSDEESYDFKQTGMHDGDVICQWFDKNQDLRTEGFHSDMLVLYTSPGSGIHVM